jgi:lipoprotein-releasing system permease protein
MSRLPFELFLALRYLRPKRTFVSVITLISVIGVMLGVAVLIIVISVMSGFDKQLRDKILGFNAHLKVFRAGSTIADYPALIRIIRANPKVVGAAPAILNQAMVQNQPEFGEPRTAAPWVRGIDPQFETNVSMLHTSIIAGSFDLSGRTVLLGTELSANLGVHVGDHIAIFSPTNLQKMAKELKSGKGKDSEINLAADYTVGGIFDVGFFEYNANVLITSLDNAQDLFVRGDKVDALLVMLQDPMQADSVAIEVQKTLGAGYRIGLWSQESSGLLDALVVEKNVMFYLLFFIMIVAAFGIMNSLITFVVQKTREIGMLKALGGTRGQVLWLFLSQSLTVGVAGVITGFGLGMLALHYRNEFLRFMNRLTGFELFPAKIYYFSELPAIIVPRDIILICGSALIICVLAGLVPAWTAARLEPVEALRHE